MPRMEASDYGSLLPTPTSSVSTYYTVLRDKHVLFEGRIDAGFEKVATLLMVD